MTEENQDKTKSKQGGFSLSDTLVVAVFPLMGYLILFIHESGYFGYFKVPRQFISFSTAEILIATGGVLGIAFLMFFVTNLLSIPLSHLEPHPAIRRRIRKYFPITLVYGCVVILGSDWTLTIGTLVFSFLLFGTDFLVPIISERDKEGYLAKLASWDEKSYLIRIQENSLLIRAIEKGMDLLGGTIVEIGIYISMGLVIVYLLGMSTARNQKQFRVTNTTPEMVVLYIGDDKLICSPFNRITKEIEPVFKVIEYAGNNDLEFRLEEVGPLKLREISPALESTPTITPSPSATPTPIKTNPPERNLTATPSPTDSPP
jgi:hypothetical protein